MHVLLAKKMLHSRPGLKNLLRQLRMKQLVIVSFITGFEDKRNKGASNSEVVRSHRNSNLTEILCLP